MTGNCAHWAHRLVRVNDLGHRRDLVHIRRHFTNAARVVNGGNVAMMLSEIVLRIAVHARTP